MRTYGRVPVDPRSPHGPLRWVQVETDGGGLNDGVYLTTLAQVLLLNRNESPAFANYGIPARDSVMQQIFPDHYVVETQSQFAPFFASVIVAKRATPAPRYDIQVICHNGYRLNQSVPIPT